MSKHEKFILTPITSVINEMKTATSCIGAGIENYPLWDYILQATFTKMTGFQEQKMKCIDWELATNGYEYRRSFLESNKKNEKGEYSTYLAKNIVYKALVNEIIRYSGKSTNKLIEEIKKRKDYDPIAVINSIIEESNVIYSKQRDYGIFVKCKKEFSNQYLSVSRDGYSVNLFESKLIEYYKDLYDQRNRIAHNTLSYQQNLPELAKLSDESCYSRNYFVWFAILVLIDEIFMELYREYMDCLKKHSYFEE